MPYSPTFFTGEWHLSGGPLLGADNQPKVPDPWQMVRQV